MNEPLLPVEIQITEKLRAGQALTVRWDCGCDESFVHTQVDGQELTADYSNEDDFSYLLDQYLTERLELPSAGEFSMEGTGRIFAADGNAVIAYQSQAFINSSWLDDMSEEELAELAELALIQPESPDSDEAEGEALFHSRNMSEHFSGQLILFRL